MLPSSGKHSANTETAHHAGGETVFQQVKRHNQGADLSHNAGALLLNSKRQSNGMSDVHTGNALDATTRPAQQEVKAAEPAAEDPKEGLPTAKKRIGRNSKKSSAAPVVKKRATKATGRPRSKTATVAAVATQKGGPAQEPSSPNDFAETVHDAHKDNEDADMPEWMMEAALKPTPEVCAHP